MSRKIDDFVEELISLFTTGINLIFQKIVPRIILAKRFFHSIITGTIVGIVVGIMLGILIDYKAIQPTLVQIAKEMEEFLGLIIFVNLTLFILSEYFN